MTVTGRETAPNSSKFMVVLFSGEGGGSAAAAAMQTGLVTAPALLLSLAAFPRPLGIREGRDAQLPNRAEVIWVAIDMLTGERDETCARGKSEVKLKVIWNLFNQQISNVSCKVWLILLALYPHE